MPPLRLWKGAGVRSNDFKFIDRTVGEYFEISCSEMWIHKYLGPVITPATGDASQPGDGGVDVTSTNVPELGIQDVLNGEVRDRSYDTSIYSLKGHYQLTDTEFNLSQFGLFLSNDTIFITFHLYNMVAGIGRTLMSGDVIEIVHRRDDQVLGVDYSISKYYVVQEGTRPADGWSPTWWNHLWRVKCTPITDSQEYAGILGLPATDINGDPITSTGGSGGTGVGASGGSGPNGVLTLGDLLSTYNSEIAGNDAVVSQAQSQVPFRNLQAAQFYISPDHVGDQVSIFISDGIPPNGSKPVPSGVTFPNDPQIGDYFIRTDYMPAMLFLRKKGNIDRCGIWVRVEVNWRTSWTPAHALLTTFINNGNTMNTMTDGTVVNEQQDLRLVLDPRSNTGIV